MPPEGRLLPTGVGGPESAITPIIGTMLVFVIIFGGMAGALIFGVPAITSLQDRAAVDDMATQLQAVRREAERLTAEGAGASVAMAPSQGSINLEEGTRMAVAVSYDGTDQEGLALAWGKGGKKKNTANLPENCDLHIQNWTDGDATLRLVATDCKNAMRYIEDSLNPSNAQKCWRQNTDACFQAVRMSDYDIAAVPMNRILTWSDLGSDTYDFTVRLDDDTTPEVETTFEGDWYFQLSKDPGDDDSSADLLFAKAYIFEMAQLRWVRDEGLTAWLEGGAVFATRAGTHYLHSPPIIDESITGRLLGNLTYYVRIIRFQGEESSISGTGTTNVFLRHNATHSTTNDGVVGVRFDFDGDGAELWCSAFMRRDVPTNYYYQEHEDFPCDGSANNSVRSVQYAATSSACDASTMTVNQLAICRRDNVVYFQMLFTEVLYDVTLRP